MPDIKVVTICGSIRGAKECIKNAKHSFELAGYIVLAPTGIDNDIYNPHGLSEEVLSEMHFKRIEISDVVYICNVGGYIGSSTQKEIEKAKSLNKPIYYAFPWSIRYLNT